MTSWSRDGAVACYTSQSAMENLTSQQTKEGGGALLASNGTVDAQGITRAQFPYTAGDTVTRASAQIVWSTADLDKINAQGAAAGTGPDVRKGVVGKVSMWVAPATAFTGTPTCQQIVDWCRANPGNVYRAPQSGPTWRRPGDQYQYEQANQPFSFFMIGPDYRYQPNTKFWVFVSPVLMRATGFDANGIYIYGRPETDEFIFAAPDVAGRAVSMWTNRTPAPPVITSPINGSVQIATMDLSFTSKDPDGYFAGTSTGVDLQRKLDIAGVQVQYAPRPSAANPNPDWIDLPFARTDGSGLGPGFYIENSTYNGSYPGLLSLARTQTIKVKVGSNVPTAGQGLLPAGVWQIRMRTFDYGHPVPIPYNVGDGSTYTTPLDGASYTPETYPQPNKSLWSDPVVVQIAAQVPPPVPLDPKDNTAVPNTRRPVLSWQYKNTVQPPYPQKGRTIQMRKVGDLDWTTISASVPSVEYQNDLGFEGSTNGGWFHSDQGNVVAGWTSNSLSPSPGAHSGDKYLRSVRLVGQTPTPNTQNYYTRNYTLNAGDTFFFFGLWANRGPRTSGINVQFAFYNSSNQVVGTAQQLASTATGWVEFKMTDLIRPAGAVTASVFVVFPPASGGDSEFSAIDDVTFRGAITKPTDPTKDALAYYEVGTPSYQFTDSGEYVDGWTAGGSDTAVVVSQNRVRASKAAPTNGGSLSLTRAMTGVPNATKTVTIKGYRQGNPVTTNPPTYDITVEVRRGSTVQPITIKAQSGTVPGTYPADSPWAITFDVGTSTDAGFDSIKVTMITGSGAPAILDVDALDVRVVGAEGFALSATNQYEWRVQTYDTTDTYSNYSVPARFWIVPGPSTGVDRIVGTQRIDGATLGIGHNTAVIYRRGGKQRVGQIKNVSSLEWNRVRDDISTAKIVVDGYSDIDAKFLADLKCWAHEVVIFRNNGYETQRVWEGPITLLTYDEGNERVTIQAKDVMAYAYRRIMRQAMNDSRQPDTVTSRATRVLQNAFAPDDPNVLAYLTVLSRTDDAKEYRNTPAYGRTPFEEVDDMAANAGLDYTTVGRAIVLWGTKHRIGTLPEFRNEHLGAPPIVSEYGMSAANVYAISNGAGAHGEATRLDANGIDPVYGLIEILSSSWASDAPPDSGTYSQTALNTLSESYKGYAERSIADRYPPPVVVRVPDNTSINPSAVVSIQQLVPGVVIPLRSVGKLRKVIASQKLDSVKVTEVARSETIQITMSPFSRDDAAGAVEVE